MIYNVYDETWEHRFLGIVNEDSRAAAVSEAMKLWKFISPTSKYERKLRIVAAGDANG